MTVTTTRRTLLTALAFAAASSGSRAAGSTTAAPAFPRRVATIEWAAAETMVAIGMMPITTASPYRMHHGVSDDYSQVPGLGSIFAPNMEALQSLKPDVILCASWQQSLRPMLERIAPVHMFDLRNPPSTILKNTGRLVEEIGALVDRTTAAETYLAQSEAAFDHLGDIVRPAKIPPFLIGTIEPDGRHISIFGSGSLLDAVLARIGLTNAWTGPMSAWGSITCGIETLASYPETSFLYLDTGPNAAAAKAMLDSSTLWNSLPSVQQGRVKPVPYAWLFGGRPTALRFAQSIAAAVVSESTVHGNG